MNIPAISTITGAYSKRSGYTDDYPMVPRCMAFVDMSSFTAFATAHGSRAAAAKVARFRAIVRTTTGKHGIRVARWLGDGALLVGLNAPDVLVAICDIAKQCHKQHIPVHCGVTNGEVIIFEGDDYLGSILNIASRLVNMADSMEAYCYNIDAAAIPAACRTTELRNVAVRGAEALPVVTRLSLR